MKEQSYILDYLTEGFQVISFEWRYLYLNDAAVKQSRFSCKEELIGYSMQEKYPGIESSEMFKMLQRCMKKRTSAKFENEFTYPDDHKKWFELRIEPVPDGLCVLSMDITERKRAEQDKKEYIKGLENVMHMATHTVRQPISNILGIAHLLDGSIISPDEMGQVIGYMKESVLALDAFTKDLTASIYEMGQRESRNKK